MTALLTRETKTFDAEFKAVDTAAGTFEAIVSVFGNKDLSGDVVMPGAFADTLALWAAKGDPIPVIWSHEWDDPFAHIGYVMEARETEKGLWVTAQLDIDVPFAAQVHRLLSKRRVTQFSFGYFAEDVKWVEDPSTGRMCRELHRVTVFEVGPTLLGMNPDTELISAASATHGAATGEPAGDLDPAQKADSGGAGDTQPTVDIERAQALLVRPMHEGISNE